MFRYVRRVAILLPLSMVFLASACLEAISQAEIARQASDERTLSADTKLDIRIVPIGESVIVGDLSLTVTDVLATDGRDISSRARVRYPSEGNLYLLVDILLENVGEEPVLLSSRQQFNLFDSRHESQKWALVPIPASSIDGEIDPGRDRQGKLVWEVSEDATGLKVVFGETVFTLGDVSSHRPGFSN